VERGPDDGDEPGDEHDWGAVAVEPSVSDLQPAWGDVELVAVLLDQLDPAVIADSVGDARSEHVAEDPEHDDPEQRQVALEDVKAGEQHRRLGARDPDHRRAQREQRDAGEPEVADDVRRQVNQRVGDGSQFDHGRQA
jgi:hypothetical protein